MSRLVSWVSPLLVVSLTSALLAKTKPKDEFITGDLFVDGLLSVQGDAASFGTHGDGAGFNVVYADGQPAVINFSASASQANWIWMQENSRPQLLLSANNELSLFRTDSTSAGLVLRPVFDIGVLRGQRIAGYGTALTGYLDFKEFSETAGGLTLGTAAGDVFTIRFGPDGQPGNVGIGTNEPAAKLDVVGDVKISGSLLVGGSAVITDHVLSGFALEADLEAYQQLNGNASGLTDLNASALVAGTVPDARLSGNVTRLGADINLTVETTGELDWSRVGKVGANLADLPVRVFGDLQEKPTDLAGYGIIDAVQKNTDGDVVVTGALTVGDRPVVTVDQLSVLAKTVDLTNYQLSAGSAAGLTDLNASELATGIVPAGRLPATVTQLGETVELEGAETTGNLTWSRVDKTGSNLTELTTRNFGDLQSIPTTLLGYGITDGVAKDGSGNVTIGGDVTVGGALTLGGNPVATTDLLTGYATTSQIIGLQSSTGSGANLTDLNASELASGTVPGARLATVVTQLGETIELDSAETTGDLAWIRVSKTGSSLADLANHDFATLSNIPTDLAGHGITDAVQKTPAGDVVISGTTTLEGAVTVNGLVTKLRVVQQGDLSMGEFTATPAE